MIAALSGGHIFDVAWYDTNRVRHDDSLIAGIGLLAYMWLLFLYCCIKNINPWK